MFPLKLPYKITVASILLSVTFALTANKAQTVTVSDANLRSEKDNWQREIPISVKQEQRVGSKTLLTVQRQHRTALVIGNGAYQEDPLFNPVNDATDITKALEELGFDVIFLKNKDLRGMEEAIEIFSRKLRQGGVGVFYYAGHGVQVNGENYLVPLKAQLNRQKDVRYEAVPLGKVLNAMEDAQTQVNIVIIDACRDNPFYRRWRSRNRGSGLFRGLAPVQSARGTLISFATAPGEFAEDGEGKNSPFTGHLLRYIKTPNLLVEQMFKKVREAVEEQTNRSQTPWEQSSLTGDFSFNPTKNPINGSDSSGRDPPPSRLGAIRWNKNGHYYELIIVPKGITWSEAHDQAKTQKHAGVSGHLVTVTSQQEDAFIQDAFGKLIGDPSLSDQGIFAWIGLTYDVLKGDFRWITGESFSYSNWADGEPSNSGTEGEHYVHYWTRPSQGGWGWNDLPNDPTVKNNKDVVKGYIIEYDVDEPF